MLKTVPRLMGLVTYLINLQPYALESDHVHACDIEGADVDVKLAGTVGKGKYSFDRHVLFNHEINGKKSHADMMHVARLRNSLRVRRVGNYLQALTRVLPQRHKTMKKLLDIPKPTEGWESGKIEVIPNVADLQRSSEFRIQT
ncbi:hypothetical protein ABG067_001571 [Albugo candida]